jgi:hypothetical protein
VGVGDLDLLIVTDLLGERDWVAGELLWERDLDGELLSDWELDLDAELVFEREWDRGTELLPERV